VVLPKHYQAKLITEKAMKLDERIVEVKRLIADGERHKDEDVGHKIALKSLKTHLTELLDIEKSKNIEKFSLGLTKHSTSDYLESIADIECYLEAVLDSVKDGETLTKRELEIELSCLKTALENMLVAVARLGESDGKY
jgi:hypothetical protein